jgi:hypothetical protein
LIRKSLRRWPIDYRVCEFHELIGDKSKHVGKTAEKILKCDNERVRILGHGWMILLFVSQSKVIVGANHHGHLITSSTCDMVKFDAAPISLATHGATWIGGPQFFEAALL